jgi:beta-glucosidase
LVNTTNPFVIAEIEKSCDAILVHFGVQDQALLDIVTGTAEPSALLPFQLPADMNTVEEQLEDVPRDMKCYTDSEGNIYDFAFGLNWKGMINDDRVKRYK